MAYITGPQIAPAASYGRQIQPNQLRDEAWAHQADNDKQQQQSQSNSGYAQGAAQNGTGFQGGAESQGLANNEANTRNGYQNSAMGMARSLANGNMPSQGAYQLQEGLNQAQQQQRSIAAGARGSAAIANSGADSLATSSNLQQNAYTQGGILKAQDMATGRGLYGSLSSQQADQDQQRLGQGNAMSQFNAQQKDKYTTGMAGMATGYGQLNNAQEQQDQGWNDIGMHPVDAQAQMDQEHQRWLQEAQSSVDAANRDN